MTGATLQANSAILVKTAWTARYALKNKAFTWVYQALNDACFQLPLPVRVRQ
jgi:hypothetical protein